VAGDPGPAAGRPGEPVWDDRRACWLIKTTEHFDVCLIPMIYNDRVTVGPKGDWTGYEHGWCYDAGPAALLAALVWDPETQDMPVGFKKQATPGQRRAPRSDTPENDVAEGENVLT